MSKQSEGVHVGTTAASVPDSVSVNLVKDLVTAIVTEMKKPTPDEQKKLDAEALKVQQRVDDQVQRAKAQEQSRKLRRAHCTADGTGVHGNMRMGAFVHSWVAQIHRPAGQQPYMNPMCLKCQYQVGNIVVPFEQTEAALHTQPNLTVETLEKWKSDGDAAMAAQKRLSEAKREVVSA